MKHNRKPKEESESESESESEQEKSKIVLRNHLIFCDSRDCIGQQSITDAQTIFKSRGGRPEISGNIKSTTGEGISPIVITTQEVFPDSSTIKNGDRIIINGVRGNTAAQGSWRIQNVVYGDPTTFELAGSLGNGDYNGGGFFIKPEDHGWPTIKDTDNTVVNNRMTINLEKKLKVIKSISLIHAIVPRDIIPLEVYLPDFVKFTQFDSTTTPPGPQVRAASNTNTAISGPLTNGEFIIDGVSVRDGDRVLLKDQVLPTENGIYTVIFDLFRLPPTYRLERSDDMPTGQPAIEANDYYVHVTEGITNSNTSWIATASGTGTVGQEPITFSSFKGLPISYDSYIPNENVFVESLSVGFYSTPIHLWRTYFNGSFTLPNAHTPPPLRLWNPPVGGSTHQLQPYPFQTVPTYRSNFFSVVGRTGNFYLICSGYGLADLNDWTYRYAPTTNLNRLITALIRHIFLFVNVVPQSYRQVDNIELVINCQTVDYNGSPQDHYGYGDFQRFIPIAGMGLAYQPGTSDGADPTVPRSDSPVPFPNFRGNTWGPYNSPGDRFQKLGVRDTLQDLYLNHDTTNLFGSPVIKPSVKVTDIASDVTFGLNYQAFLPVTFGNIQDTTNINILNAMRIHPNGYGALSTIALGDNQTFTDIFLNSGGQGPDTAGVPVQGYNQSLTGSSWVNNEVLNPSGTGVKDDEIPVGPSFSPDGTTTMTTEASNATYTGDETGTGDTTINRRVAWYDLGPRNGRFVSDMIKYRSLATTELPDTNLVMRVFQADRDNHIQTTNENTMDCIFSCPIRLNLGSSSGTQEYVENIHAFLASSQEYWEKRFLSPLQSLHKLNIEFTTYEGVVIPLEKMLQPRRSVVLLQQFQRILGGPLLIKSLPESDRLSSRNALPGEIAAQTNTSAPLSFLFDPVDPRLIGREKRNLSLIFRVEAYEHESPGLLMSVVRDMLKLESNVDDNSNNNNPNLLKASNYENYLNTYT